MVENTEGPGTPPGHSNPFASPSDRARRRRGALGVRAGAAVVAAGGLAAGSYAIASATARASAALASSPASLAATSATKTPIKVTAPPLEPFLGGPREPAEGKMALGAGSLFGEHGARGFAGGTLSAIGLSSLTIKDPFGGSVTVATNGATTYHEGLKAVSRSALASGDRVAIELSAASTSTKPVASAVEIIEPSLTGTVVSVSGATITVRDAEGFWRTIDTSPTTTVTESGKAVALSAVRAGDLVYATGAISSDHTTLDATSVEVVPAGTAPPEGGGELGSRIGAPFGPPKGAVPGLEGEPGTATPRTPATATA